MEKTTKKRKKSKRLKRRIGLIAVGGLSFVLTICLSVGATLAWFAGSTWASNDLYMGGPVYVEMAGRGENGYTADTGSNNADLDDAVWKGGSGSLDIKASSRSTGTADGQDSSNILLPGQKLLVYSQARVYSTLQESTVEAGASPNQSSGANNSNTIRNGEMTYYNGTGKVQTTTTSVLRAKFSINIEFDPSVGFNNFTDIRYAQGYPTQSSNYLGEYGTEYDASGAKVTDALTGTTTSYDDATVAADGTVTTTKPALAWTTALGATKYSIERETTTSGAAGTSQTVVTTVKSETGRRDAVANAALTAGDDYNENLHGIATSNVTPWVDGDSAEDCWQMKWGISKAIYKWKYVSKSVWEDCGGISSGDHKGETTGTRKGTAPGIAIGEPFNGLWNTAGTASKAGGGTGNGFYAIWEVGTAGGEDKLESDGFYNARTSNYLQSYVEHYVDDYNRNLMMEVGSSLEQLETALNNSFINLVNQSSDNIWAGNVMGFDAGADGRIVYDKADAKKPDSNIGASWLYVDPTIGNDTNAADSASAVGGWWYLVESTGGNRSSKDQVITTEIDNVVTGAAGSTTPTTATTVQADGTVKYEWGTKAEGTLGSDTTKVPADAWNNPYTPTASSEGADKAAAPFKRYEDDATNGVRNTDKKILNAKLFEITPVLEDKLIATAADGTTTTKVVSYAFPFVNGNFELPGQAMTNIFANAKFSFQITFQALQAFFPFAESIDSIPSGTAITGTAKALNISNAIPIFNEAFDYLSWL